MSEICKNCDEKYEYNGTDFCSIRCGIELFSASDGHLDNPWRKIVE